MEVIKVPKVIQERFVIYLDKEEVTDLTNTLGVLTFGSIPESTYQLYKALVDKVN